MAVQASIEELDKDIIAYLQSMQPDVFCSLMGLAMCRFGSVRRPFGSNARAGYPLWEV